jgi:hypothetical protein
MGIIIHDTITLPNGLKVNDGYAGFSGHHLNVLRLPDTPTTPMKWAVQTYYSVWVNKDASDKKMPCLITFPINLTTVDLSQPIFTQVYAAIKANYNSTSDA